MTGPVFTFGDYEAEDAWDAGDEHAAHVHNLVERLHALADHLAVPFGGAVDETAPEVLDVLEEDALAAGRDRAATDVDVAHIAGILADVTAIRDGGVA